ncbi:MAG: hypothetical protein PWR16_358 [Methanoculleus sp.]|nr:hypothetical protein [Methanoculleus sp.]
MDVCSGCGGFRGIPDRGTNGGERFSTGRGAVEGIRTPAVVGVKGPQSEGYGGRHGRTDPAPWPSCRTFEEFVGDRMCLPSCSVSSPSGGDEADSPGRHRPGTERRKIAGLRDISVHSCYAVKPTILRTKLGPLEGAVETMIQEEGR